MSEQDCRSCKNWQECKLPPEHFNYAEVRWCPFQVIWIIQNLETLESGRWPVEEGGSDNNNSSKQVKTEASFVKPEIITAELRLRLEKTGIQGKLLVAQVKAGETLETLGRDALEALMFCKGWRRKRRSFRNWKKERRYRKRKHEAVLSG